MANILSGANFGLVMPRGANPNFGAELSAQLLGQATAAMREKATQDRGFENLQKLDAKRNELLSKADAEKTRLNVMYTELDRIYNMPHGPAKRTALAQLGNAQFKADKDGSEFIDALNAETPDALQMNINRLRTKAGALADQVDKVLASNAPPSPLSPEGELQTDINRGILTKDQASVVDGGATYAIETEITPSYGAVQTDDQGNVTVRNSDNKILTGQAKTDFLKQEEAKELATLQKKDDIKIATARKIAMAKGRQERTSALTQEYSVRKREAARSDIKLRSAATLANQAEQGVTGSVRLQAAKLFPGIDVSSEGALTAAFTDIALDQLQRLKGPSTDFEFVKMEQIGGEIGDPKTANIARLKSLQRNSWFIQRESDQFRTHVKAGGDPDDFSFNFGEPVKTKRGVFTLQDLQDTAVKENLTIDEVIKRLN